MDRPELKTIQELNHKIARHGCAIPGSSIEYRQSDGSQPWLPFSPRATDRNRSPFPVTACSVSVRRTGQGAILPRAMRTSSITPFATRPRAAMHTLEIACAFRAPTLRAWLIYLARIVEADKLSCIKFVRRQQSFLVAGVKVNVRQPALASRGHQNQVRFVHQQCRQRISGWRCVHDVAANRSPILIRDSARPAGRTRQESGNSRPTISMLAKISVSASRTDPNLVVRYFNAAQFGKIPNADQLRAGSLPAAYCTITSVPPAIGSHMPGSLASSETTHASCRARPFRSRRDSISCIVLRRAASATASIIWLYPVQRQRLPERPSRISSIVGSGFRFSKCTAARIIPGVQMPHCAPPQSRKVCCKTCIESLRRKSFDRNNVGPLSLENRYEAAIHEYAVHQHRARTTLAFSATFFRARQLEFDVATRRAGAPSDKHARVFGSPLTVNEISALPCLREN
jgi:hypothetical protein